jgi:glycosyltransferase involved in cell wall biosynthesis
MQQQAGRAAKITFLMPRWGTKPIGGFKVVYEYANYLAERGHEVSIIHPAMLLVEESLSKLPLNGKLREIWKYVRNRVTGDFKPTAWFNVSPKVKLLWVPNLAAKHIPDGNAIIATAWQTAEWLENYPQSRGKKFYLIQHLETWSGSEERVFATWKSPLEKIVIARWLQKQAEAFGHTAHLVHNGLDFQTFRQEKPQEEREPRHLLMIYHTLDWKGSADGLAAYAIARKQEPGLRLTLFGMMGPPNPMPEGAEFFPNPPQSVLRDLYNGASIFISPSWTEGFPLPPAEALQCGAALVGTDIDGTAMYAIHEKTALLSPVKNPEAMAANILRMLRDTELRLRLARNGHEFIQQFTWERAGAALEKILVPDGS